MMLLQKKQQDGTYYNFSDILAGSYSIEERPKELSTIQYSNNKRKKYVTSTNDVIIQLTFSPKDEMTMRNYITNLKSGTFKYYSIIDNEIKENDFIVEIDNYTLETYANNTLVLEDFDVELLLGEEV